MKIDIEKYPYPRRRVLRGMLKTWLICCFLQRLILKLLGRKIFQKKAPYLWSEIILVFWTLWQ